MYTPLYGNVKPFEFIKLLDVNPVLAVIIELLEYVKYELIGVNIILDVAAIET